MAWIKSYQEIERHPKTIILMGKMGWTLDTVIAKLHRLWWWCADYAYDGDLTRHAPETIAAAVGMPPEQGKKFLEALAAAGFVDIEPCPRLHDWWSHFGDFLRGRFARTPEKWKKIEACYTVATPTLAKCSPLDKRNKGKEIKKEETTLQAASAAVDGQKPVNWDNCRNDLQRLIAHYIRSEMPELYKTGTQAQATALFKRYGRPASELLGVSGDLPTAKRAFDLAMAYFRKKGLSWNLSTVTANSAEFVNAALQEKSKV